MWLFVVITRKLGHSKCCLPSSQIALDHISCTSSLYTLSACWNHRLPYFKWPLVLVKLTHLGIEGHFLLLTKQSLFWSIFWGLSINVNCKLRRICVQLWYLITWILLFIAHRHAFHQWRRSESPACGGEAGKVSSALGPCSGSHAGGRPGVCGDIFGHRCDQVLSHY